MKTMIKATALAIALALSAGCASNKDLQSDVDSLNSRIDALEINNAEAAAAAVTALEVAEAAALIAEQSQDCCDATNEKIDRMFEQSQSK